MTCYSVGQSFTMSTPPCLTTPGQSQTTQVEHIMGDQVGRTNSSSRSTQHLAVPMGVQRRPLTKMCRAFRAVRAPKGPAPEAKSGPAQASNWPKRQCCVSNSSSTDSSAAGSRVEGSRGAALSRSKRPMSSLFQPVSPCPRASILFVFCLF